MTWSCESACESNFRYKRVLSLACDDFQGHRDLMLRARASEEGVPAGELCSVKAAYAEGQCLQPRPRWFENAARGTKCPCIDAEEGPRSEVGGERAHRGV